MKGGFNAKILIMLLAGVGVLISFWLIFFYPSDPFIEETLSVHGSIQKGNDLFRMNCVGCHGISAQGLVGPDIQNATLHLSDKKIINQVTKGLTPPMPSFDIDVESMADLLAYLHSLPQS